MLKQISIENFKAFADLQEIDLAPITLIYGANSSGKSSIIHSLMVLKQSILFPNLKGGVYSDKRILDVGSYSTMVYSHQNSRDIAFGLRFADKMSNKFDLQEKLFTKFVYTYVDTEKNKKHMKDSQGYSFIKNIYCEDANRRTNFGYCLTSKYDGKSDSTTRSFTLNILPEYDVLSHSKEIINKDVLAQLMEYFSFNAEEELAIPKGATIDGSKFVDSLKKLQEDELDNKLFETLGFLSEKLSSHTNLIKKELKKISYLGPLRSNPKRYYSIDTEFEITVGKEGENIAYFLKSNKENLTKKINTWFERFHIPYYFNPRPIGERNSEPLIQIELKDLRNDVTVSPLDVGFGIGQILPILIEGVVREDSVICVEQPEIHLHPRLQAELAEFFVETCTKNQWIIETHSEALILRIQKIIRNRKLINGKRLKPEDISILYVIPSDKENDYEGAEVIQIRLDEDGDFIDFWPEGFFEERIREKR
ncbi:DUF3696 domain-containing protein [Acinetobacter baumannii]|nr:DUF3696 domain-containing protein [Acinetobacter baumannii]MDO7427496.1 DUF3696 domain-containing protein [Acinetobacter baumannii]